MNVLIVDTSVWIEYFKGNEPFVELDLALKEGRVYLAPVVAGELLSSRLPVGQRTQLSEFLAELPLCDSGFEHWARVGELRARLATQGLNLSTPDAHIAQCALDLDGYLFTRDGVFRAVSAKTALKLL